MQTNNAPAYNVKIGGMEFTQTKPQGLEHLTIEDDLEKIGRAEFSFRSGGGANAAFSNFQVGGTVEVKVGGGDRLMFSGTITEVNHGKAKGANTCIVVAMDPLYKAATTQSERTWEEKTDGDIVKEVLGNYPMGTVDATDFTNKYMHQRNEKDYAFLRRLASRNGYFLYCNEGKIDFVKPQQGSGGLEITKDNVIDFNYENTPKQIPSNVIVEGWDYNTKQKVVGNASEGDVIKIGSGELALGDSERKIVDSQVSDQAMAKTMAVAELNRLARTAVRGTCTVQGTPELHAGVLMKITQQQAGHNPEVMVVSARHRVSNKSGLVTQVTFCSNTKPK